MINSVFWYNQEAPLQCNHIILRSRIVRRETPTGYVRHALLTTTEALFNQITFACRLQTFQHELLILLITCWPNVLEVHLLVQVALKRLALQALQHVRLAMWLMVTICMTVCAILWLLYPMATGSLPQASKPWERALTWTAWNALLLGPHALNAKLLQAGYFIQSQKNASIPQIHLPLRKDMELILVTVLWKNVKTIIA